MHRKLLTLLVSACALAAVLAGPATASAATLTLQGGLASPATEAYFESDSTAITFGTFSAQCGAFSVFTDITQNSADPVTLQVDSGGWAGPPSLVGCPNGISYSNIQLTAAMQFNANGTGTLPLRVTETWNGGVSCVRQGTLNLTYTPNTGYGNGSPVTFDGYLNRASGSIACPPQARLRGTFGGQGTSNGPTDEFGLPIEFVVTP